MSRSRRRKKEIKNIFLNISLSRFVFGFSGRKEDPEVDLAQLQ